MTTMAKKDSLNGLKKHFPSLRTREEILEEISANPELSDTFYRWPLENQTEFLECCSGARGMKVLYDGVFKELFNPETTPERLERLLFLLLGRRVSIKTVLPNDSVRLGAETSLLYTDIIVQMEDDSIANVEVQKIGYAFPGERCACYSADHLLRQYKRVRGKRGKHFSYRDVKNVYTIVFFEQSPQEFHEFPGIWRHKFKQQSNSGLEMNFLQEYILLPLDIYKKAMQNKSIETELEAWLAFLCFDAPERIEELINRFPEFAELYQQICDLCRNTEKVMSMYSKELEELDHNTVLYMIDEMQAQIDRQKAELERLVAATERQRAEAEQQRAEAERQKAEAERQKAEAERQKAEAERQKAKDDQLISQLRQQLADQQNQLSPKK